MKRETSQVIAYEFTHAEIVALLRRHSDAIIPDDDDKTGVMIHGIHETGVRVEVVYRGAEPKSAPSDGADA